MASLGPGGGTSATASIALVRAARRGERAAGRPACLPDATRGDADAAGRRDCRRLSPRRRRDARRCSDPARAPAPRSGSQPEGRYDDGHNTGAAGALPSSSAPARRVDRGAATHTACGEPRDRLRRQRRWPPAANLRPRGDDRGRIQRRARAHARHASGAATCARPGAAAARVAHARLSLVLGRRAVAPHARALRSSASPAPGDLRRAQAERARRRRLTPTRTGTSTSTAARPRRPRCPARRRS